MFWILFCSLILPWTVSAFTFSEPSSHRLDLSLPSVVKEEAQGERRFMYMTEEEDEELRRNGDREAKLMAYNLGPLRASNKVGKAGGSSARGFGGGGGFGGKSKKAKQKNTKPQESPDFLEQAKQHAKQLKKDGVVRIDNILPEPLVDNLKEYLVDLRARGTADIEKGVIQDSQERFADVLLNQNRCDLKIPLGPEPVNQALSHILLQTPIRTMVEYIFDQYGGAGKDATLYELNCFMSNQGARRQLVHADNVCVEPGVLDEDEPIMLTCFVALQDTDASMGPTTWILGTHNRASHEQFYDHSLDGGKGESPKDRLLRTAKKAAGTLPKGACAVFDPRTLHCAGANNCKDPNMTRALFYLSFKNPRVDHPGCPTCSGYGIADADLTMQELCKGLEAQAKGQVSTLDLLARFP